MTLIWVIHVSYATNGHIQEPMQMNYKGNPCAQNGLSKKDFADIDLILMGMASQRAEREDNMIVEDLRGNVFGPLEFSRRDLMAINIQRGRDHGWFSFFLLYTAFLQKFLSSPHSCTSYT